MDRIIDNIVIARSKIPRASLRACPPRILAGERSNLARPEQAPQSLGFEIATPPTGARDDDKISSIKHSRGMTLVEMLFAAVIFSLVSIAIYAVVATSNSIFHTNDAYAQINQSGMQVLRHIAREIEQTSSASTRLDISGNGSIARFQIPVDDDDDGDVVAPDLASTVSWGAYDQPGQFMKGSGNDPLNRWVRYSVSNGQLKREVLNSALTPITALERIMANNVQTFIVARNDQVLTMAITFNAQATVSGGTRTLSPTASYTIFLRNAAN